MFCTLTYTLVCIGKWQNKHSCEDSMLLVPFPLSIYYIHFPAACVGPTTGVQVVVVRLAAAVTLHQLATSDYNTGLPRVSSSVAVMERVGGRVAPSSIASKPTLLPSLWPQTPQVEGCGCRPGLCACVRILYNTGLWFLGGFKGRVYHCSGTSGRRIVCPASLACPVLSWLPS